MARHWKFKLGAIQRLNDGTLAETKKDEIPASLILPFEGRLLSSFFASYLSTRESGFRPAYYELISCYLFQWEIRGIITTELTENNQIHISFHDRNLLTDVVEQELYDILSVNSLTGYMDKDEIHLFDWGQKVLALGETELLETNDVAFDQKGRIRFTKQGYDKSLAHASFEKYWENLSFITFYELDEQRQKEIIIVALSRSLTEEIEAFAREVDPVPEVLQIANRIWRF